MNIARLKEKKEINTGRGCGLSLNYMESINKTIGGIYYTDFHVDPLIMKVCLEQLKKSFDGEIVSVSLKRPLDLGKNIVIDAFRSYPTMVLQILTALEASTVDYVFFLEHDLLYCREHFDFFPKRDDIYYYNINNYRWAFGADTAITYDGLTSLSGLCCNRELAIKHYKYRLKLIKDQGLDKIRSREPRFARKFGYEPATKSTRNGGVTNEEHIKRKSTVPNVDIRHRNTFSAPKITLDSFKHKPKNWKEIPIKEIPGWDLKKLFNI